MTRKELDLFRELLQCTAFFGGFYNGTRSKEARTFEEHKIASKLFRDNYELVQRAQEMIKKAEKELTP